MPKNRPQTWQLDHLPTLPNLGQPAQTNTQQILGKVDTEFDSPMRLSATFPTPDAFLRIHASQVVASDGAAKSVGPVGGSTPAFSAGAIDFQNQTTAGGPITIVFPASTVGRFRRCAFAVDPTGTLLAVFSSEALTVGALDDPATLFDPTGQPVGWVDLECTDSAGKFKTAGSATNIIENAVGGIARIVRIAAGAGGTNAIGGLAGEVPFLNASDTLTVTFSTPRTSTRYNVDVTVVNLVDGSPQFLVAQVTNKTTSGFTVKLNSPTDSANYAASYILPGNIVQNGERAIAINQTSVIATFAIPFPSANYAVVAQLQNTVDGSVQFQPVTVVDKQPDNFTAEWNDNTDSANYVLSFQATAYV